ncbi:axonemal dynein light chain domain-containing protein 1-like [Schistosoma japonicum]|nr:axonemal dynein light chain domain-containing protein 1-like [Schistosoma japonicum]KAH8862387.1 axonemal dynein light chain domain-containing protein 1-like [Schistosoma japonicum]KAH8862388.1 axonemal dynein light chain domain-containing protein 1-like [Schistosoma japonicum]KAH8862389.1 axonemal dynein light chain domain-containing protein 1-like [Schistosoma japonicum]
MTRPSCAWNFPRERERFKHLVEELMTDPILSGRLVVVPTWFPEETVQCYERGKLLADIRMFYKNLIESLLIRFSNLYTELFCQELLCRQVSCLNEKYINETNSIFQRMQIISESNEAYKSEEKELETKFKSKLSEVSMEEYLLNEFKHCYENQRKFLENRLEDMKSDYQLWNSSLKLLNYYIFSQLSISHESNVSNLAQICFDLQQTVEIWGFIGIWLVESLKLYDTMIMSKIDKLIQNDWYIRIESVISELNARDEQCELRVQKINSLLKSLNECIQQNISVDDLLGLLGNLLQTINECLDLFNGECILNIEEKLAQIEHIQINWFEMFYQSSHYDELMSDDSRNYEKEMTIQLQKELNNILNDSRFHLQGEDGIVQYLTKFLRSIEDFIQFIQVNTIDNENEKIANNYASSELQIKISSNVEQNNQKLWKLYSNYWMLIMKNNLNCQYQTYNDELKKSCLVDSIDEEYGKSDQWRIVFDEFNQMNEKLNVNLLKCQHNSIKWFELMLNRVECINEMRIQQITFERRKIDTRLLHIN